MAERSFGSDYRFGFNGKENDDDVKTDANGNPIKGSQQDYGMRIYDPRIAKFLSVDPLTKSYPWYTPYQFAGNNPIRFVDLDGLEEYDPFNDVFFVAKLALTTFYDKKHSAYNLVLNFVPSDPGTKWQASYKQDANGNEIFETEIKQVPNQGAIAKGINASLDVANLMGVGKFNATDILAVKSSKTQVIRTVRMIGEYGAQFESKTILKFKGSKARIDVENPNPGQRAGQIHFQDANNTKFMYDFDQNKFFGKNKESGTFDVEAPKYVNELLKRTDVQKAIEKGKNMLGETKKTNN